MVPGDELRIEPVDVELVNVTKRFGGVTAVDRIALKIEKGTYCCLVGPSGCGKTTTLRMIAGHETIDDGTLRIGSTIVNSLPPSRRGTAMMFQSYALFPHMTALANVAFPLKARGVARAERQRRAADLLDLVHMSELKDRYPAALSGGQQQRVALARALVTGPSVLLLDEPLSALDPFLRTRVRRELKRLQLELGITFVHVTHAQDESMALSDIVVVMNKGRIVQSGPPEEIYGRPRTPFVANFLGGYSVVEAVVLERVGDAAVVGVSGHRVLVPNLTEGAGTKVTIAIRGDSFSIAAVVSERIAAGGVSAVDASWTRTFNAASGTVASAEFGGTVLTVVVALQGGGELVADLRADELAGAHIAVGSELTIRWPASATFALENA